MLTPVEKSVRAVQRIEKERLDKIQMEEARMQDVLLLLQLLAEREEVTIKLILDCLYDIGSANLVDQKVPIRPLNRLSKLILAKSKPMFRRLGLWWFKKNCPQLIADWLYTQVSFTEDQDNA